MKEYSGFMVEVSCSDGGADMVPLHALREL